VRRAFLLLLGPVVATVASCLGPTEIQLHITTNACAALSRTDIYVGGQDATLLAPGTSTGGCTSPGDVGTLTIVPSGGIEQGLQLAVVGAVGGTCSSPATTEAQCIVARRSLSFVPHTRLDLPIFLDSTCAGHVCPETQTCVVRQGAPVCIDASCNADGGVSCSEDAGTTDVSVPPACVRSAPDAGAPTLIWSFDDRNDNQIHEDTDGVPPQPILDGFFASDIPTCGMYFNTVTQAQPLVVDDSRLASSSFEIAFAYDSIADQLLLSYDPTKTQNGGYQIGLVNGFINVTICSTTCGTFGVDTAMTADGQWHTFALQVTTPANSNGSTVSFYRDGQPIVTLSNVQYVATQGTLSIASGVTIDQVEYYAR
jgi:hypothetical protein